MLNKRLPGVGKALALTLLLGLLGAVISGFAAGQKPATWTASRQLLIRAWNVDSLVLSGQPLPLADEDRVSAATVASSYEVMELASRRDPSMGTPAELKSAVSASLAAGSNFIEVKATGADRVQADKRAQAVSAAFTTLAKTRMTALASALAFANSPEDVKQRAAAVKAMDPVQTYRSGDPVQGGGSKVASAGAGFVIGAATGLLIVGIMTLLGARRARRDAQAQAGATATLG